MNEIIKIAKKHNGIAIGGLAEHMLGIEKPLKDYDIIIPYKYYHEFIAELNKKIKSSFEINKFGGMKFSFDGIKYDIWADDILSLIKRSTRKELVLCDLNKKFEIKIIKYK